MAEYIERDALIADIEKRYCKPCEAEGKDYNHIRCRACWVDDMVGEIGDFPHTDVAPVRHGRWISLTDCANAGVYCSVCHKKVYKEDYAWCNKKNKVRSPYCPNCGATMDLEEERL